MSAAQSHSSEMARQSVSCLRDDGVLAGAEFVVTQVDNNFVVPVFDRHRLPLFGAGSANVFAKVSGDDPGIAVDWCVDLEAIAARADEHADHELEFLDLW